VSEAVWAAGCALCGMRCARLCTADLCAACMAAVADALFCS
jgi:hypothetical protein